MFIYQSINQSIYLSKFSCIFLSIYLSVNSYVGLSVTLSVYLSVCFHVYLSINQLINQQINHQSINHNYENISNTLTVALKNSLLNVAVLLKDKDEKKTTPAVYRCSNLIHNLKLTFHPPSECRHQMSKASQLLGLPSHLSEPKSL